MANVEKDIKVRPSVRQITQRMNFYEANIEKPKNVLMLAEEMLEDQ